MGHPGRARRARDPRAAFGHPLGARRGVHRGDVHRRSGAAVLAPGGQQVPLRSRRGRPGNHRRRSRHTGRAAGPGRRGTVHHVAWRVPDDATQRAWRAELVGKGVQVTSILDRQYFHSIYFREPGGTLLELATEDIGFTADEPLLELGRSLKLPPWLEPNRAQIEAALPALNLPDENNPEVAGAIAAREGGAGRA
ncbi:VOC family protein [Haloechinothrix alba]|uniref:VOC family protein n=1 Tax=Haloechinothrix alba TaxID=664784 RepID=UPI001FE32108|nr:VOC family protein [Haloechinothrix alba]